MTWLTDWAGESDASQLFATFFVCVMLLRLFRFVLSAVGLGS